MEQGEIAQSRATLRIESAKGNVWVSGADEFPERKWPDSEFHLSTGEEFGILRQFERGGACDHEAIAIPGLVENGFQEETGLRDGLKLVDENRSGLPAEKVVQAQNEKARVAERGIGEIEIGGDIPDLPACGLQFALQIPEDGGLSDLPGSLEDDDFVPLEPWPYIVQNVPGNNVDFLLLDHGKINDIFMVRFYKKRTQPTGLGRVSRLSIVAFDEGTPCTAAKYVDNCKYPVTP
jgi:hypothetical protein